MELACLGDKIVGSINFGRLLDLSAPLNPTKNPLQTHIVVKIIRVDGSRVSAKLNTELENLSYSYGFGLIAQQKQSIAQLQISEELCTKSNALEQ